MARTGDEYREVARVVMHLPEGMTKIELERFHGIGMADGGVTWDIETETIALHLRAIGSRFVVTGTFPRPSASDTAEDLRALMRMRPQVTELDTA